MDQVIGGSLLDRFSALDDPRQVAKVLYPLPEIILLLLCATLAGADDFVEMGLWGECHLAFLRHLRPYLHGIPSHDTLGEVMRALDPAPFKHCFAPRWRDCAPSIPISSRSTAGPCGARRPATRAANRCIWCPPGRASSSWCSGRKR